MTRSLQFRLVPFVALVAVFAFSMQARADLLYSVEFEESNYTRQSGEIVDVSVKLVEVATAGETLRLAPGGADGFFSFGFRVDHVGAQIGSANDVQLDPLFTDAFFGSSAAVILNNGNLSFEGAEDFIGNDTDMESGVGGVRISDSRYELELATISFTAGAAGSVANLTISDHQDNSVSNVFADNFDLDSVAVSYGTSQISVVPEPGHLSMLVWIGIMLTLVRRTRPMLTSPIAG